MGDPAPKVKRQSGSGPGEVSAQGTTRGKRGSLLAVDQILWSGGNFAVAAAIALMATKDGFGRFIVFQAIYVIGMQIGKSVAGEVLLVSDVEAGSAARLTVTGAMCVGAAAALLVFVVLTVLGAGTSLVIIFPIAAFVLISQDGMRYALLTSNEHRRMVAIDAVWTGITVVGIVVLIAMGVRDLRWYVAAWVLGAFVAWFGGRVKPASLRAFGQYVMSARRNIFFFVIDNLVTRSALSVLMLIAGAGLLTTAELADVGLSRTLIAPAQAGFVLAISFGTSELTRNRRIADTALLRRMRVFVVGGSTLAVGIAVVASFIVPRLAEQYDSIELMVHCLAWGLQLLSAGLIQIERVRLRAADAMQGAMKAQALTAALVLASGVTGMLLIGSLGLILGSGFAHAVAYSSWRSAKGTHRMKPGQNMISVSYRLNKLALQRYGSTLPVVVVNEFPKSGGTWFARMLSSATGLPFIDNGRLPIASPSIVRSHWPPTHRYSPQVYVVRDGRDAMVSWFHHRVRHTTRTNRYKKIGQLDPDKIRDQLPAFLAFEFDQPGAGVSMNWNDHVLQGLEAVEKADQGCLVKFEELKESPVASLTAACEMLGNEVSESTLDLVVDLHSLERTKERESFDQHQRSFVRQGAAGGWRDIFTEEAHDIFWAHCADAMHVLGYTR